MPDSPPLALVVDDDPILRMLVRRSAERAGFEVVEAASMEDLAALLPTVQPRLMVLDLNLADASGKPLLIQLAELGCRVPTLPLSGLSEWEVTPLVNFGRALGLDLRAPVFKPISSARLTEIFEPFKS